MQVIFFNLFNFTLIYSLLKNVLFAKDQLQEAVHLLIHDFAWPLWTCNVVLKYKAKFEGVGTFFTNRFPSLEIFVSKKKVERCIFQTFWKDNCCQYVSILIPVGANLLYTFQCETPCTVCSKIAELELFSCLNTCLQFVSQVFLRYTYSKKDKSESFC